MMLGSTHNAEILLMVEDGGWVAPTLGSTDLKFSGAERDVMFPLPVRKQVEEVTDAQAEVIYYDALSFIKMYGSSGSLGDGSM